MERPETGVVINDFPGLASNRGRLAGKPGDALTQTNLYSPGPGKLQVRKGRRTLAFTGTPAWTGNVIAAQYVRRPSTNYLVAQTSNGQIVVAETPA